MAYRIQVHWECRCGRSSEMHAMNLQMRDIFEYHDPENTAFDHEKWSHSKDWYGNVVLPFHNLKLSHESDKLMAISGLAKLFMEHDARGDDEKHERGCGRLVRRPKEGLMLLNLWHNQQMAPPYSPL